MTGKVIQKATCQRYTTASLMICVTRSFYIRHEQLTGLGTSGKKIAAQPCDLVTQSSLVVARLAAAAIAESKQKAKKVAEKAQEKAEFQKGP